MAWKLQTVLILNLVPGVSFARNKRVRASVDTDLLVREAATVGVLWKKVFLEISQSSQENICARVSFLIKFQASSFAKILIDLKNSYKDLTFKPG